VKQFAPVANALDKFWNALDKISTPATVTRNNNNHGAGTAGNDSSDVTPPGSGRHQSATGSRNYRPSDNAGEVMLPQSADGSAMTTPRENSPQPLPRSLRTGVVRIPSSATSTLAAQGDTDTDMPSAAAGLSIIAISPPSPTSNVTHIDANAASSSATTLGDPTAPASPLVGGVLIGAEAASPMPVSPNVPVTVVTAGLSNDSSGSSTPAPLSLTVPGKKGKRQSIKKPARDPFAGLPPDPSLQSPPPPKKGLTDKEYGHDTETKRLPKIRTFHSLRQHDANERRLGAAEVHQVIGKSSFVDIHVRLNRALDPNFIAYVSLTYPLCLSISSLLICQ
jgi:hypothetical protein